MTEQHRAAPELWAAAEKWGANTMDMANCILELRDRVKALEAAQRAHIEAKAADAGARCAVEQLRSRPGSWQPIRNFTADEVAPIVVPTAADARQLALVERVADALNPSPDENPIFLYKDEARAAIRVVAEWLKVQSEGHLGSGLHWATRLEQEANR